MTASEGIIRKWYDLYNRRIPEFNADRGMDEHHGAGFSSTAAELSGLLPPTMYLAAASPAGEAEASC